MIPKTVIRKLANEEGVTRLTSGTFEVIIDAIDKIINRYMTIAVTTSSSDNRVTILDKDALHACAVMGTPFLSATHSVIAFNTFRTMLKVILENKDKKYINLSRDAVDILRSVAEWHIRRIIKRGYILTKYHKRTILSKGDIQIALKLAEI